MNCFPRSNKKSVSQSSAKLIQGIQFECPNSALFGGGYPPPNSILFGHLNRIFSIRIILTLFGLTLFGQINWIFLARIILTLFGQSSNIHYKSTQFFPGALRAPGIILTLFGLTLFGQMDRMISRQNYTDTIRVDTIWTLTLFGGEVTTKLQKL